MSFNGSGTYNLPAGNPVVSGTTIQSTWANNTLADIAAALSNTLVRDGQAAMTGDLNFGGKSVTNALNGTFSGQVSCGTLNVTSATIPSNGWYLSAANTLAAATAATQRITINSTGNVVVNAATSGVSLSVGPGATNGTQSINASTITISYGSLLLANTAEISSATQLGIGTNAATGILFFTSGIQRLTINPAGNAVVNAPSSGVALAVNGVGGTTATFTVDGGNVWAGIPQNLQSGTTYVSVASDANKHIYGTNTGAKSFSIAAQASVNYQIGTAITFQNGGAGVMSITANGDTLVLAGTSNTATRNLAINGICTALKIAGATWVISGTGLT